MDDPRELENLRSVENYYITNLVNISKRLLNLKKDIAYSIANCSQPSLDTLEVKIQTLENWDQELSILDLEVNNVRRSLHPKTNPNKRNWIA